MKKAQIALVVALFVAGSFAVDLGSLRAGDDPPTGKITSIFNVEGMTCRGCEVGVRMNVEKLDGVVDVEVSYKEGHAVVTYKAGEVTPEQIVEAIEKLGYTAKIEDSKDAADSKETTE